VLACLRWQGTSPALSHSPTTATHFQLTAKHSPAKHLADKTLGQQRLDRQKNLAGKKLGRYDAASVGSTIVDLCRCFATIQREAGGRVRGLPQDLGYPGLWAQQPVDLP
jgi:hypothetical protein